MKTIIVNNGMWIITDLENGYFTADATEENKLCYPEHRFYLSKDRLERDFEVIGPE